MRSFAEIVASEALAGLGLSGAALDDEGDLAFELSGCQVLLSHRESPTDSLWITVGVGAAPQKDHQVDPDAMHWMLVASGEQWLRSGLTLGLDGPSKQVCYRFVTPTGMATAAGLSETISAVVAAAADLRETLASRRFDIKPRAAAGAPASNPGFV